MIDPTTEKSPLEVKRFVILRQKASRNQSTKDPEADNPPSKVNAQLCA